MRIDQISIAKRMMRLQRGTWIVLALAAAGLIYVNAAERVGRIEVIASPTNPNWEWSQYFMARGWPLHYLDCQPNPKWSVEYFGDGYIYHEHYAEPKPEPRFLHVFEPLYLVADVMAALALLGVAGFLMEWRHRNRRSDAEAMVADRAA